MQALRSMKRAGFQIEGLIHIGANDGQERHDYLESGADPCIYVEPIDAVFQSLQSHVKDLPGHRAVQAVCSDTDGEEVEFNIASNGGLSSSILGLGAHAEYHPSIVYSSKQTMKTKRVDTLISEMGLHEQPNLMILDTQGAELKVLRGAQKLLRSLDGVFTEVSELPLYEGGCSLDEITSYMRQFGFRMRWLELDAHGHGDAFYCRGLGSGETLPTYDGNLALNKPAAQSSTSIYSKINDAAGAVSGRKNGTYGFHTDFEDEAWWQVDLGSCRRITEIRIYNRVDVVRERSKSLRVLISADEIAWFQIHDQKNRIFGGADGRPLRIFCQDVFARHVRLQLSEFSCLHLDEVEVY